MLHRRFWILLGLLLFSVKILIFHKAATVEVSLEDASWVQGFQFNYSFRLTASYLYRYMVLPLFGDRLSAYPLTNALFHLANAALVYLIYQRLFRRLGPSLSQVGGLIAGLLFVHSAVSNAGFFYLSALAYLLVTTAILGMVFSALIYFDQRHPLLWLPVLMCFAAALFSHSYALGAPILIFAVEATFRPPRSWRRAFWGATLRYGIMVAMALIRVGQIWQSELHQRATSVSSASKPGASYWEAIPGYFLGCLQETFSLPVLAMGYDRALSVAIFALALLSIGVIATRIFRGTARLGPWEVFGIFFFAWNTMTLPQLLYIMVSEGSTLASTGHRLYLNQIGGILLVSFLLAHAVKTLAHRLDIKGGSWSTPLGASGCVLVFLLVNGQGIRTLPGSLTEIRASLAHRACATAAICPNLVRGGASTMLKGPGASSSLRCADLRMQEMKGKDFNGAEMVGAYMPGAIFKGASFRRVDASGACMVFTHGQKADFSRAKLDGTVFWGSSLPELILHRARGEHVVFTNTDLFGADLSLAKFPFITAPSMNIQTGDLSGADLRGAKFAYSKFDEANLSQAVLDDAGLEYAILRRAVMRGTRLRRSSLVGANLEKADLRGADLREAVLKECNLRDADLRGANLCGANLEGANLEGAKLQGAIHSGGAPLPPRGPGASDPCAQGPPKEASP